MSTNQRTNTNKPTHAIYQVIGDDNKAKWFRVGSAWMHKDLQGANLKFDSFPLSGRTVLRAIDDKPAANTDAGGAA